MNAGAWVPAQALGESTESVSKANGRTHLGPVKHLKQGMISTL